MRELGGGCGADLIDRGFAGGSPWSGVLFAPHRLGAFNGQRAVPFGNRHLGVIDQQGFDAGGPQIQTKLCYAGLLTFW